MSLSPRSALPFLAIAALLVASCSDANQPTVTAPDALSTKHRGAPPAQVRTFVAPLSGAEEVPPVDTRARGQTVFQLSRDGTELSFRLSVANLFDVTQAHIHMGAAGTNGPVVAWLYPAGPPPQPIPGRTSGILATGVIRTGDLVGPLEDDSLDDLIELMSTGQAYVNVHTVAHPPGEIRGQIR